MLPFGSTILMDARYSKMLKREEERRTAIVDQDDDANVSELVSACTKLN